MTFWEILGKRQGAPRRVCPCRGPSGPMGRMPHPLPVTAHVTPRLPLTLTFTRFEQLLPRWPARTGPAQNVFFTQNAAQSSPADHSEWPFHTLSTICLQHYLVSPPLFSTPTHRGSALYHHFRAYLMQPSYFVSPPGPHCILQKATRKLKTQEGEEVFKCLPPPPSVTSTGVE